MAGTVTQALVLAAVSGGLLALAFPGTGDEGWIAFGALVPFLVVVVLMAMFVSLAGSRTAETQAASAPGNPRDSARSRPHLVLRGDRPSVQSYTKDDHDG